MTADLDGLRRELRELHARKQRGEIRDKDYQKSLVDRTLDLYRAQVGERLEAGEEIAAEHHAVRAHMRLNQSVLRETDQHAVSLFATPRRLIRVRSTLRADRPVTADQRDETRIDELPLAEVREIAVRREIRAGEAIAGLVIIAIALLFRSWLLVTGKLMVVLGAAGVLHALLLQTRWLEVVARQRGSEEADPFVIIATRRKSARLLVRFLRERLRPEGADA